MNIPTRAERANMEFQLQGKDKISAKEMRDLYEGANITKQKC